MQLVQYEEARRALQICATVDEAKEILDKTAALQAYARQTDDTEMEVWLAEMKLRARRRIGEISRELEKGHKAGQGGEVQIPSGGKLKADVLSDAGLSTSVANRCEKVAEIPEERFEEIITEAKEQEKPITYADVERAALNNKPHVSNNSGENEWYTPAEYIEAAREVMGGIDLDPASSEVANQTVKATIFYTAENSGLELPWQGRIWMNPPYAQPLIAQFSDKIVSEFENYSDAIILVNNATETQWFQNMALVSSAICFVRKRIRFVSPDGEKGQPLQGQAILYVGKKTEEFFYAFNKYGFVMLNA